MTLLEGLLLGLIQGLTEFLPVSSSGHLVLGKHLLGVKTPGADFEVAVHAGTLLAILLHYRRDLVRICAGALRFTWNPESRLFLGIAVGSIPAVAMVLLFGDEIEGLFSAPHLVCGLLGFTGLVLLATALFPRGDRDVGPGRALLIGAAQSLALLPGISRSGTTIAAGLGLRVKAEEAARFSFLLAIPALVGATGIKLLGLSGDGGPGLLGAPVLLGAAAAFLSGYAALRLLLHLVAKGRFAIFGLYCLGVSLVGLWLTA